MCYAYMHDTIASPYHPQHRLYNSICLSPETIHKITESIERAMKKFGTNPFFFYRYEDDTHLPDIVDEKSFDEWTWLKFKTDYPEAFAELLDEIHNNLGGVVGKKKREIEIQITHFFMNKLRNILLNLQDVHDLHTKREHVKESSPGPLPYNQLVEIRLKANLPVPEYDILQHFNNCLMHDRELYS